MKILGVRMAKAIWLFDTQLVNPRGLAMRDFFSSIKERYHFAKAPAHEYDYAGTDSKFLVFEGGIFDPARVAVSFSIYNDGIVAQTLSDTSHTTAFLEDLRQFASDSGFSIPAPSSLHNGFVSILDMETDVNMISLNPKLEPLIRFIESKFSSLDGRTRAFEVSQIGIWSEDISKNLAPVAFKFERRIEQPFETNRYWSQAPLQTNDHIESLAMLEAILSA